MPRDESTILPVVPVGEFPFLRYTPTVREFCGGLLEGRRSKYRVLKVVLWGLVVVGGVGDVATTAAGHPHPAVMEATPLSRWLIGTLGYWALVPKKLLLVGLGWIVWWLFLAPLRALLSLSLAAGQIYLAVTNLLVLQTVGIL